MKCKERNYAHHASTSLGMNVKTQSVSLRKNAGTMESEIEMVYLKFYGKDREEHKKAFAIMVPTQNEVRIIVNKLTRHFKLKPVEVTFKKRFPDSGTCWSRSRWISFHRYETSIGVICHEVGHQYLRDDTGKSNHTKKLMTRIRRLNKYCKKMNYWGLASPN